MSHSLLPIVALILALTATSSVSGAPPLDRPPVPAEGIQGLWVWQSQHIEEPAKREALLAFAEKNGINRLLVQIHLDNRAEEPRLRLPDELAALIADAAERGIAVEALDGAKDMAAAANQERTMAILEAILAWNRTLPEGARLVGIHYDIEPYVDDNWKAGPEQRQTMMRDLLTFYHRVREKLDSEAPEMTLSADIPFWYDNKTEPDDSCIIAFNGETKNLHQHIQDVCDYIGIMSYRQKATGSNSVVAVVENELAYAEKIGKTVCPALETIELTDTPQITFHGLSAEEFWTQHNLVRQTLGDRPGFGGMLTHSYRGLRDLIGE